MYEIPRRTLLRWRHRTHTLSSQATDPGVQVPVLAAVPHRYRFCPLSPTSIHMMKISHRIACIATLFLLVGATLGPADALAQRTDGSVGLGGQVGSPSGVTLKFHDANGPSYDFLAAWDLDDFFFLNGHAQFSRTINADNVDGLELFFGPGAFIGFQDTGVNDDEVVLGISGRVGLNLLLEERFELFAQLTPRFNLVPETDGDLGGGLGFRYYF